MEGKGLRAGRGSRIVSLLGCPDTNSPKGLASLCFQTATCQVVSAALPSPDAILALMRRPLLALLIVLAAIGVFAGGLAWLLDTPRPPAGAARCERLYLVLCSTCHGADGRGSWRAALFLIRPGNLADAAIIGRRSHEYLFDIIKHGGAAHGGARMPAFRATPPDQEIKGVLPHL